MAEKRHRGPNPSTVADGYSLSDERQPVTGPDIDFNGADGGVNNDLDNVMTGGGGVPDVEQLGLENHLSNPDAPKQFRKTHEGEHRQDFGGVEIKLSHKTYIWVMCAALNSCNLGYDIGVNTGAGPMIQKTFDLSNVQIELFFGSLNLFAMVGAILAHYVNDNQGRKNAFLVSQTLTLINSNCSFIFC